jgi:hypothetical protein
MKMTAIEARQCLKDCADDLVVWFGKADKVDEVTLAKLVAEQYLERYGTYDENTQDQIEESLEVFQYMVKEHLRERSKETHQGQG